MVDSINSNGGVPPINSTNRTQSRNDTRSADNSAASVSSNVSGDEVSISAEALDLAQAEQAARDTRSLLEERIDEALSGRNTAERLNALIVGE